MSTAPSSSSNVPNYFMNNQQGQGQAQVQGQTQGQSGQNPNQISNQFWRKPNTAASSNLSNISSFTPVNTAASSSTVPTFNTSGTNQYTNNNNGGTIYGGYNNNMNYNDKEERLKIDLKIKESQIESLENEIQRLSESMNLIESTNGSNLLNKTMNGTPVQIPKNINEIFNKLTTNYSNLEQELNETKQRLESLVTAITLNPTNSITNNGRYDELEISHKIILKLDLLKKENEELLKQLSFGKSKEVDIELNLLKMENAKLKEKLKQYEKK